MTTMTENGVMQSPHEQLLEMENPLGEGDDQYHTLPDTAGESAVPCVKQSAVPLFSQHLLTVEQLSQVRVDADIQASVNDFLKGLTTQMFARIVRNGSDEVGGWLGAKVQSERDGWTAMLRMAMDNIEYHRKNALQGQVVLHHTLDQLRMLVDCFHVDEEAKKDTTTATEEPAQAIHACVHLLADCCNALMEDRFQCLDALECGDSLPPSLASAVKGLRDKVAELEAEKASLQRQLHQSAAESSQLRRQNEQLFEDVHAMEEKVRSKQDDLESLKTQLKEVDEMVKMRKRNVADKCVGTNLEFHFKPLVKKAQEATVQGSKPVDVACPASSPPQPTAREHMFTQTCSEPTVIELSEEKLRVLKERARKLENSLHGAIASMDKLRKVAPRSGSNPLSSSSSSSNPALNTAVFLSLPSQREVSKATSKSWMAASFQVTNAPTSSVTAPVPKLGRFQPATERRCFSERPAAVSSSEEAGEARGGVPGRGDSRKVARTKTGQVSKCLRCQKIFTATDNHKLACCYHGKGKERMEVYSDGGQLVRVNYVWKCCHQQGEADGCCYGHHV